MMTGIIKSAFQSARSEDFDPECVINRVKSSIRTLEPDRFITLCCARLDVGRRTLTYANAGHPPVLLRRPQGQVLQLPPTGPLLSSALGDLPCALNQVSLDEGDLMLFYTDGITETMGTSGQFGKDRVLSLLSEKGSSGSRLLDEVLSAVADFAGGQPGQDDMTLLAADLAIRPAA
jgi:sigma-B regulation protein RsbU (phosphoserine phosphatase)